MRIFIRQIIFGLMLLVSTIFYGQDKFKIAQKIENEIQQFITKNVDKYTLTPEKEEQIFRIINIEENEHHHEYKDLQNLINEFKKNELRKLYFNQHPENINRLSLKDDKIYICDNGNFDIRPGFENYDFRYSVISDVPYNCGFNTSMLTPLLPTLNINSFNSPITLVDNSVSISGGFDEVLYALSPSIAVPRVNSNNYAIKLNDNTSGFGVASMSKKFLVNSQYVSYSFSLIVQNPLFHKPEQQPHFIARIERGNGTVLADRCIIADVNNTGMFNNADNDPNAPLLYTGWQCDFLKISDEDFATLYENEVLNLVFIITDCGQGAHYGTVYIDDICDSKNCEPVYGNVNINIKEEQKECPDFPFNICGDFTPPQTINTDPVIYGLIQTLKLDIIAQDGSTVISTLENPLIDGNNFCFEINESSFGVPLFEEYGFRVNAIFDVNGYQYSISEPSQNVVPDMDIKFTDCCKECIDISDSVNENVLDKKEALVCVNAHNVIEDGASALYHAGYEVVLLEGFLASYASTDRFYIEPCTGNFEARYANYEKNDSFGNTNNLLMIDKTIDKIRVFPNPTNTILNIEIGDIAITSIKLISLDGKTINVNKQIDNGNIILDLESVSQGVYILSIEKINGEITTQKIVKN